MNDFEIMVIITINCSSFDFNLAINDSKMLTMAATAKNEEFLDFTTKELIRSSTTSRCSNWHSAKALKYINYPHQNWHFSFTFNMMHSFTQPIDSIKGSHMFAKSIVPDSSAKEDTVRFTN